MKQRRWVNNDGEASKDDRPTSYLDAAHRLAKPVTMSPSRAQNHVLWGSGMVDTRQHGPEHRRRRCRRPLPQLVHSLPARPLDGRIPACQRLGHRGRVSIPNADGWREILQQQGTQLTTTSVEHHQKQLPQARRIPTELQDICFNCLSYSHRVATCRLPRRCLRCHSLSHLARECKRSRSVTLPVKVSNQPRHSASGASPAS
jgi:hypothetical protein